MAKGKRRSGGGTKPRDVDPADPDADSDSFYHDEVDRFHMDRDQVLLDTGAQIRKDDASSGEEEVLAYDDDSDEEDEEFEEMKHRLQNMRRHDFNDDMASDLEDDDDKGGKEGERSEKAWGSARSKFYGGHDSDIDEDLSGSEPEAAALEEREALAIQQRLLQTLDDDDMGLDTVQSAAVPEIAPRASAHERISTDLSQLSTREKLALLHKQSPELKDLVTDMKARCTELKQTLLPIQGLIRAKKLSSKSSGAKLVETKTALYMNYLVNVSFYLTLKAKQIPVENHPVIKRLVQFRNLMKQLEAVESRAGAQMDALVSRLQRGDEFPVVSADEDDDGAPAFKSVLLSKKSDKKKSALRKRLSELVEDATESGDTLEKKRSRLEAEDDDDENEESGDDLEGLEGQDEELAEGEEDEEQQRRGINYQIEKNKGLTTKKRKELRNPRVKHKLKYRKAKIRRRGQVRDVRTEMHRYGGEISGIRSGIIRSTKFK